MIIILRGPRSASSFQICGVSRPAQVCDLELAYLPLIEPERPNKYTEIIRI